jgi:hypothetical protein
LSNIKWYAVRIILLNMFGQILTLGFLFYLVHIVLQNLYNIDIISLILSDLKFIPLELIVVSTAVIFCRKFYKHYSYHSSSANLDEKLRREINPLFYIESCIITVNSHIDSLKLKADILKSFSPIPIIILFLGGFIETGKTIDLNTYGKIVLVTILIYFTWLINVYKSFRSARYRLADYERRLLRIKNKNNYEHNPPTNNNRLQALRQQSHPSIND